jgi:HAD superfamily hydrolase (TIGR01509 family)
MDWDLVIFDCDGVLVDSEPITLRLYAAMLAELGLTDIEAEWLRPFIGLAKPAWVRRIEQQLRRALPPGFVADFYARLEAAFRRELRAIPGVAAALQRIVVPVCVASNGNPAKVRTALSVTGLLGLFDGHVFSVAEVARGKPYPDLLLHAARCMGAAPLRFAVVEDSCLGVEAAVAAGMRAFGYAGQSNAEPLAAAGALVFHEMGELPALLERNRHSDSCPPASRP